jgi:hypothetical protein
MAGFDYNAEAELFPGRDRKHRPVTGGLCGPPTPSDSRSRSFRRSFSSVRVSKSMSRDTALSPSTACTRAPTIPSPAEQQPERR